MKTSLSFTLGLLVFLACSANLPAEETVGVPPPAQPTTIPAPAPAMPEPSLAAENDAFALALYAQLSRQPGNLLFSPMSIHTSLAALWAGARGETARQIENAAQWKTPAPQRHKNFYEMFSRYSKAKQDSRHIFDVACSLWTRQGAPLKENYVKLLRENYNTTITPVDFVNNAPSVRNKINSWARQATRNGIEKILTQSPSPETGLLLLNSAYFRGDWFERFDSAKEAPFFLDETRTVTIPLMYKEARFLYGETEDFQLVKMWYSGTKDEGWFSMLILLPTKKTPEALKKLEQSLIIPGKLDLWRKSMSDRKVKLSLPKFSFNCEVPLTDTLKTMGMGNAFSNTADFSNVNGEKNLSLSGIQHKTFIRVDEKGTAAGAITNIQSFFGIDNRKNEPAVFRADHPFILLICEEKDGILFMGRVNHPVESVPYSFREQAKERMIFDDNKGAVFFYKEQLDKISREKEPLEWAELQSLWGTACAKIQEGDLPLRNAAVQALRNALTVRTREAMPLEWAETQEGFIEALSVLVKLLPTGKQDAAREELIRETVEACRALLDFCLRETEQTQKWNEKQLRLGKVLDDMARLSESADLAEPKRVAAEAAQIFRDIRVSLEKDKFGKYSREWRIAGYDLTASLLWQADKVNGVERELLLEEAETLCRGMRFGSPDSHDRAMIHRYLASVLCAQSTEFVTRSGKRRVMNEAIVELEGALEEIPERVEESPWRAQIQKELGTLRANLESGHLAETFLAQAEREKIQIKKVWLLQEAIALLKEKLHEERLREIAENSNKEPNELREQWRKKLEKVRVEEEKLRKECE
jgi:serpin B